MLMPLDEFLDIAPNEFFHKLKGFNELREQDARMHWEISRKHATEMINVWTGKQYTPEMIWPLPWDQDRIDTEEEVLASMKQWKDKHGTTL